MISVLFHFHSFYLLRLWKCVNWIIELNNYYDMIKSNVKFNYDRFSTNTTATNNQYVSWDPKLVSFVAMLPPCRTFFGTLVVFIYLAILIRYPTMIILNLVSNLNSIYSTIQIASDSKLTSYNWIKLCIPIDDGRFLPANNSIYAWIRLCCFPICIYYIPNRLFQLEKRFQLFLTSKVPC